MAPHHLVADQAQRPSSSKEGGEGGGRRGGKLDGIYGGIQVLPCPIPFNPRVVGGKKKRKKDMFPSSSCSLVLLPPREKINILCLMRGESLSSSGQ